MSLNSYLHFFLKSEVLSYEREAYQRDVLHFIGRENWSKYTMIMACNCQNEAQDALYGNRRVHNKTMKNDYRCTSCGTTRGADGTEAKGKKGKK